MPTFVLRLIAPRPNFAQTMTDAEREIMSRHAAHWRPYLERGDMVAFGPILTDDDSYGLAVVETDDDQVLREFAAVEAYLGLASPRLSAGYLLADRDRTERSRFFGPHPGPEDGRLKDAARHRLHLRL